MQGELFMHPGNAKALLSQFACTNRPVLSEKDSSFPDTSDAVSTHIASVALHLARTRGYVSADDFHDDPTLLAGRDGRVIGAVLRSLVKAGAIRAAGYFASTRNECHHRPIQRFEAV